MPEPSLSQVDAMREWLGEPVASGLIAEGASANRPGQLHVLLRIAITPSCEIVSMVDDVYPGGVEGFLANHKEQG